MLVESLEALDFAPPAVEAEASQEVARQQYYQRREFSLQKYGTAQHADIRTHFYYDQQTSLRTNFDGSSHIQLTLSPVPWGQDQQDDQIIGKPRNSSEPKTAEQQRGALRLMPRDTMEAVRVYVDDASEGLPILRALGYEIACNLSNRTVSGQADITVPSTERMNQFLNFVRSKTGFAPNAVDFDGGEFSNTELRERLMERAIMISNRFGIHEHDLLIHSPAWSLMTEETMKEVVSTPNATHRADISIDAAHFGKLVTTNLPEVRKNYSYLLYEVNDPSSLPGPGQGIVEKLALKALRRTEEVTGCAEEFNALQQAS